MGFPGDYNRKEKWYQGGYLAFWRAGSYGRGGGAYGAFFRKGRLIPT